MNTTNDLIVNIDGMNISVKGHRKVRICVGIPVTGGISPEFFREMLLRMEEWSQTFDIVPVIETAIPHDEGRNRIAKAAIDYKCDYIFFIDSDTLIQKGQLEQLLSHGKDAISGISYMKALPYYSLIRKKIGYRLYNPIEPSSTELIRIDGAGFGCFLVKTDVFNKIEYPWFQFKYIKYEDRWRHIGEDLYFCDQLENAKIEIYCDPTVQCVHIGTHLTIDIANRYKDLRLSILNEVERSKKELSEFTGMSLEQTSDRCHISTDLVAEQYKQYIIEQCEDPKKFYKENKDYIFDLINWHVQQRIIFDMELVKDIKNKYPSAKKILDYGSGCGQNAIMLAEAGYDVYMADYEGYTSDFAKFRAKKRGLDIKCYDIEKPIDDKFDMILAFDVLEHVPDDQFKDTINRLKNLKQNGCKILTTVSFGNQNGAHPMHYESSPEKIELIKQLVDEQINDLTNYHDQYQYVEY